MLDRSALFAVAAILDLVLGCTDGGGTTVTPTPRAEQHASTSTPASPPSTIEIAPADGACSREFIVSGSGWTPGTVVSIYMREPNAGAGGGTTFLTSTPAEDGTFRHELVPDVAILCEAFAAPTLEFIATSAPLASDPGAASATATFTRSEDAPDGGGPAIALSRLEGACYEPPVVKGSGFAPGSAVRIGLHPLTRPGSGGGGIAVEDLVDAGSDGSFVVEIPQELFESFCARNDDPWFFITASGLSAEGSVMLSTAFFRRVD